MFVIRQHLNGGRQLLKGTWKPVKDGDIISARVCCPGCGRSVYLDPDQHSISAEGKVSPSLVCPFDDCEFHEYVKLGGWNAGSEAVHH